MSMIVATDCKAGVKFDLAGHKRWNGSEGQNPSNRFFSFGMGTTSRVFKYEGLFVLCQLLLNSPKGSKGYKARLDKQRLELNIEVLPMNRYQPKKCKIPVKAIREMCIECMGGRGSGQNYSKLIEECGSPCCPAFAFRFGTNPHKKTKTLTREHKQALLKGSFC